MHKKEFLRCSRVFTRCAMSEVISGPSSEIVLCLGGNYFVLPLPIVCAIKNAIKKKGAD